MILADRSCDQASIWQLVESCAYVADLESWAAISHGSDSVLDLGCGIGRVGRYLAARGCAVLGVDRDPAMVADLNRLATEERVAAITGDATEIASLDLGRSSFETIIAPQQLLHILGGEASRGRLLEGVKTRLAKDGTAAFAISEVLPQESREVEILPDVRELDDWVYASRPVAVEAGPGKMEIIRLRQVVAPDGSLEESHDSITFDLIDRGQLADELAAQGLGVKSVLEVPETERHIASVIVIARHLGSPG